MTTSNNNCPKARGEVPLHKEISNNWLAPFDGGRRGCSGSAEWRQAEEQRYRCAVNQVIRTSDYLKPECKRQAIADVMDAQHEVGGSTSAKHAVRLLAIHGQDVFRVIRESAEEKAHDEVLSILGINILDV